MCACAFFNNQLFLPSNKFIKPNQLTILSKYHRKIIFKINAVGGLKSFDNLEKIKTYIKKLTNF